MKADYRRLTSSQDKEIDERAKKKRHLSVPRKKKENENMN